jgi:hypothetical protein
MYNVSMQRARTILMLGIWVAILPYLGFPSIWKNILFTLTGLGLVYFSFVLYKEFKMTIGEKIVKTFENFSENKHFNDIRED